MKPFDLTGALPAGRTVLEASAGTGKTYSLTGLIVRYIAENAVPVDQLLVVTFTRAAANELRDRTRRSLEQAVTTLATGQPAPENAWMTVLLTAAPADPDELARRRQRLVDAISRFDELTITTIHGFCQQTLSQLGVRSGNDPDAVLVESINDVVAEVCRDAIITELADQPLALQSPASPAATGKVTTPKQAETELINCVTALMSNPGAATVPGSDAVATAGPLAARWVTLVERTHEAVVQRQRVRGEIGYDTLISGLRAALAHPTHGHVVAAQLAQRYAVVLVDEFQDTDRVQWDVFDRAFAQRTLITVGDPKQAIYRFRGADVHAYLDAVEHADALGLTTNHRSDALLLQGLARLFDGATLGDPRIPFVPVGARADAPRNALTIDHADHAAISLRVVPNSPALRTKNGRDLAMAHVRSLVLADLVRRCTELLDHGCIAVGGPVAVQPGDIAVLVPTHAEADHVAEALRRADIPAVRTRTGSVLQTPAALQWRMLLAALAQPHQIQIVRSAALGWFLDADPAALAHDDVVLAGLQERVADLGDRLRLVGVSAFYDEQKARATAGASLVATVLGRTGGERHLTDLDHISELLAAAMQGGTSDPAQVLRALDDMIANTDERNEAAMRRIDSDALAVQITTVHSAKGLEYPIVLVPFGFKPRPNIRTPHSFTSVTGVRTLDIASKAWWDAGPAVPGDETTRQNHELRRHQSGLEIEADELRLLYVALTRPRHHLEIWWASVRGAGASALGRILLDRDGAGPVRNTPYTLRPKTRGAIGFHVDKPAHHDLAADDALHRLRQIAAASGASIELTELADHIEVRPWAGRVVAPRPALQIAANPRTRPVGDARWQRWSFSRLGSTVESEFMAGSGGYDEPAESDDEFVGLLTAPEPNQQLQLGIAPAALLGDIIGGTRFGTFVHAALETLDCTSPTLETDLRVALVVQAARDGLDVDIHRVAAGLAAAVRTPLGPLFAGKSLADIHPRDRLAELEFDMPIAAAQGAFTAGRIGQILLAELPRHDPLRSFARSMATEFAHVELAGWMHGSIDAALRVAHSDGPRYLVVDYKTNKLNAAGSTDPVAAYHPRLLLPAMEHSRYPLQALLYTLALHRYLRWRLGSAYAPDHHLGGVGYLFLRGMVGPATPVHDGTPHGVFAWRPPTRAILAIDDLFARGGAA